MKFYDLYVGTTTVERKFSFPLAFVEANGRMLIGKYEWRQGRDTDWVISGGDTYRLDEFVKVALVPLPDMTLDQKLQFLIEDHVLEHGGYINLEFSRNWFDDSTVPTKLSI
jgi:GDP-D-mannose dehydratase